MKYTFTLGGGDAKRIMAGDVLPLYEEKLGLSPSEDLSGKLRVQIGVATEDANLVHYTRRTGNATHRFLDHWPQGASFQKLGVRTGFGRHAELEIRHWAFSWMTGTPDAWTSEGGTLGIVDAKHTGDITDFNPPEAIVARNYWQMMHYLAITGWGWADLSVIYGNDKWQSHRIYRDEEHIAELIGREIAFLEALENRAPPVHLAEAAAGAGVYRPIFGEPEIKALPLDAIIAEHAPAIVAGHGAIKAYEAAITAIKAAPLPEGSPREIVAHGIRLKINAKGSKSIEPAAAPKGKAGDKTQPVTEEKAA